MSFKEVLLVEELPCGFIDAEGNLRAYSDFDEYSEPDSGLISDKEQGKLADMDSHFPCTVEWNQRRIRISDLGRQSVASNNSTLSIYDELGGHQHNPRLDEDQLLDGVIRGAEPWMLEVNDAVERFGLNEITAQDILSMKKIDRAKFLVHFRRFYQLLCARQNLIERTNGNNEEYWQLTSDYGTEKNQDEMLEYARKLKHLIELLKYSGIVDITDCIVSRSRTKQRVRKKKPYVKTNHRDYQVISSTDVSGNEIFYSGPQKKTLY